MVKNKSNPKVSIVIPVYNGSNYLAEAIDSALAQTYKNIEVIVVNDGSSDNGATEKIAQSYGNKIRYYKKENGGVATALNLGIEKMTGEYFSWLSHDDMYKPTKIKQQINFLKNIKTKDPVVLYSNYELINENGRKTGVCKLNHELLNKKQIYSLLRGSVNGITMLIPKSAFVDCGKFDESLRCTQDYDMWLRMIRKYKFVHMKDVLSSTRIHSLQDTQANPSAVAEGNLLWIKMVDSLSEEDKIKIEGSMFRFYLEMVKFVMQTPYQEALKYCAMKLEDSAQNIVLALDSSEDLDYFYSIYNELVDTNQKRALAYYFSSVIKQLYAGGKKEVAARLILEKFIGISTGISQEYIQKKYLYKIGVKHTKPRLMFCTGHWLTGGMERVLSNLFKELKDDYDLFLLTAYDGRVGVIELPDYVTHIKMSNDLFYDAYSQSALLSALVMDIDVVIGFMNLFNGQLDFYELCVGTKLKTVASNNEMYFYPYHNPYYYGLIERRIDIFKKLDATLWCTNFSASAYGLVGDNSYLMPNPNTYKVLPDYKYNKSKKIILCVGRFNDYVKRVDRMLECFSIVSKSDPEAKMILVGKYDMNLPIVPGSDTTLKEYIDDLRIDISKVDFVGEVENVTDYYRKATILLVTSMSEGFGMVINEAACHGVPTVCNKIPGIEDLIKDGENGYIVDQGDIAAAAEHITNILRNDNLRLRLSKSALGYVKKFDEINIADRWRYLINTLLDDGDNTKNMLDKKLSYKVRDKDNFTKLVFEELNNVIAVSHDKIKEMNEEEGALSFISRKATKGYERYKKSIQKNGISGTTKLMTGLIINKVRR